VNLTDVNDNAPVFPNLPEVQVEENRRIGSIIYNFAATDADLGSNSAVTYSILAGNDNGQFLTLGYVVGIRIENCQLYGNKLMFETREPSFIERNLFIELS